jgi:hypothetical protein
MPLGRWNNDCCVFSMTLNKQEGEGDLAVAAQIMMQNEPKKKLGFSWGLTREFRLNRG